MVCTTDKNKVTTIKKALKALGKKNFVFIMHNGSFPSVEGENTGFGTINSQAGRKLNHLILHHIAVQFFQTIRYLLI